MELKPRYVGKEVLFDYSGMNPATAKLFGFEGIAEDESLIRDDLNAEDKQIAIKHEQEEFERVNAGEKYWPVHIDLLRKYENYKAWEVKGMSNKIFKTVICGVKEVADRVLEFVGSTEQKDRVGDVVKADGWKTENYLKNPVFLWAHDYKQPPIGKANKVWVQDSKLMFRIQFPDAETYPFADTIYKLYKGGYLNATSVGFAPDDNGVKAIDGGGSEYSSQELLELSAIPVPANPDALVSAREAGLITVKELEIITKPEETENYVRIPVESLDKHKDHRIRTIDISDKEGIKAIYCGECKKILTYLFDKDKGWTMAKAEAWVKDHKSLGMATQKEYSQSEIADELDYLKNIMVVSTLNDTNKAILHEIVRLTGGDIPDDISKQMSKKLQTAIRESFEKVSGWADGYEKACKEALKACRDIIKSDLDLLLPPPSPPAEDDTEDEDKALEGERKGEALLKALENIKSRRTK